MARLFAATVLLALACVASAIFEQVNVYTDSSCSGSLFSVTVYNLVGSCTSSSCTAYSGVVTGSSIASCPSSLTSGLPSGTYVASTEFSAANCTSTSVSVLTAYPVGVCLAFFGNYSTKYTCDSNNNPSQTVYNDAACTNSPISVTLGVSCFHTQTNSTSYS